MEEETRQKSLFSSPRGLIADNMQTIFSFDLDQFG